MNIKRNLLLALTAGSLATAAFAAPAATSAAAPMPAPAANATAAPAPMKSDVPPALAKKAKITLEAARATALAKVPGGTVQSEELEREHGKLIYSFDIQVPGKTGVEEVNVNAITGKVVGKKYESAKAEAREKAMERKPTKTSNR